MNAPDTIRMTAGAPRPRPLSRQIVATDLDDVATLLCEGFPERSRAYWVTALARLGERAAPDTYPRYGYVLESGGERVGVILLIFSNAGTNGAQGVRCNVSSWYVRPAFRGYAALLTASALRFKEVSYVNISPAPNTWPILEAQGYRRFCEGVFIGAPALSPLVPGVRVRRLADDAELDALLDPPLRRDILTFCVETKIDRALFAFVPGRIKGVERGIMRLAYCRDTETFTRYAGPLGRALLLAGAPLVMLDANAPVAGLVGRFFKDRMPKYCKGPLSPRLNDLSQTEALLFGR